MLLNGDNLQDTIDYELAEGVPLPSCSGKGGYGDLRSGTPVTVLNASGEKVGLGKLGKGKAYEPGSSQGGCRFAFVVSDVPAIGSIYSIEIANRGTFDFRRSDASSLNLSIGDPASTP